nr:MAG TPA: hypothetical protein [Caudoviricetes sp.]
MGGFFMKLFIDTDWFEIIQDLAPDKQNEVMRAILSFPNGDSDTNVWRKVIRPKMEQQERLYREKCEKFSEARQKRWNRRQTDVCQTSDTTSDMMSDMMSDTTSDMMSEQKRIRRENVNVNVNVNENVSENNLENISRLSTTRDVPSLDDVLSYAAEQDSMAGCGGFVCPRTVAQDFHDYYASIGWTLPNDAHTPVRDWRPLLRRWARNPDRFRRADPPDPDRRNIDDPDNFVI